MPESRTIDILIQMPFPEGKEFAPNVTAKIDMDLVERYRLGRAQFILDELRVYVEHLLAVYDRGTLSSD